MTDEISLSREATQGLMDSTISQLSILVPHMDYYKIGGTQARGLFAAHDAYRAIVFGDRPVGEAAALRTHDSTSAINDEIPGAGDVFKEVPQAELKEGDMPLHYDLQTFNALVAANTAMESELAARDAVIVEKDAMIAELTEQNKRAHELIDRCEKAVDAQTGATQKVNKALNEEVAAHDYTKQLLATEQRRTERAKGYIDRVIDDQAAYAAPQTETVPVPPAPIGPRMSDIYDPPRPATRQDSDYAMMASAHFGEAHHPRHRRRAY